MYLPLVLPAIAAVRNKGTASSMASPPTRKLNKRTKLCERLAKQYVGPEKYYNWGKLWYMEVTNLDMKYQWTKHIIERYGHSTVRGMRSTHLYPEFQRQPLRGYKHHLESLQERTFLMCATPTFSFWSTTPLSPLSHHPSPHLPTSPPPHFSPPPQIGKKSHSSGVSSPWVLALQ